MDIERKKIQWYPGHMAKAGRQIGEKLKLIDVVIEVLDARVPRASRNPGIFKMLKGRCVSHVILLNKSDLADPGMTQKWAASFLDTPGIDAVLPFTAFDGKAKKRLIDTLHQVNTQEKRLIKCLLCGIPNVGKSAIINTLAGKKKAQTGNKPGVTKGQQWIQIGSDILFVSGSVQQRLDGGGSQVPSWQPPQLTLTLFTAVSPPKLIIISSVSRILRRREWAASLMASVPPSAFPDFYPAPRKFSSCGSGIILPAG